MSEFKLRPHHGLCMQFFEGKGYSREFTENMSRVISSVRNEQPEITLVCGEDIICGCCPNMKCGKCSSQEKVMRYDKKVLEICGLEEGAVISAGEFIGIAGSRIIGAGRLGEVCGDCEWKCGAV